MRHEVPSVADTPEILKERLRSRQGAGGRYLHFQVRSVRRYPSNLGSVVDSVHWLLDATLPHSGRVF